MRPVLAPRSAKPTTIGALTPGLLLFFDRPSFLQSWARAFGHEWRHVGVTVQTDDGIKIANYAYPQMYHLLPIDLLARYRRIGVARVFRTDEEIQLLHHWCNQFEAKETSDLAYSLSAPLAGMVLLASRRLINRPLKWLTMAFARLYCATQTRRFRDRPAFICSTFAWTAVHAARSEVLEVPMSALDVDQANTVAEPSLLDVKLSRWLCGPTDLWRAIPHEDRWDLDLSASDDDDEAATKLGFTQAEEVTPSAIRQACYAGIAAITALLRLGGPFVK